MKKYISTVMSVSLLLLGLPSIAKSAYQTQLSNTTAWLIGQQNSDGSWGNNNQERFVLTVEAVRALRAAGLRKVAYHKGLAWLENHSASNFDYKSRRALALSAHGNAVNGILTVLDNAQDTSINQRDGWGMGTDYLQSPVDTALVLTGLGVVGTSSGAASVTVQPALDYLKTAQLSGAGWPVSLGTNSDIFTTVWVVKALNTWKHQDATLTTVINNGLNALTSSVDNSSSYHLQALAAQTALEAGNSSAAQSWLSNLNSNLQTNGSLGDNIYDTTWAIRAFATADGVDDSVHQTTVNIPDAALRNSINAALGRNALDSLNRQELSQLTILAAANLGISDLTGLEWATNLTDLDLRNNTIDDTTAIDNLTLASLQLEGNPVFQSPIPVQIPMMPVWAMLMMAFLLILAVPYSMSMNSLRGKPLS